MESRDVLDPFFAVLYAAIAIAALSVAFFVDTRSVWQIVNLAVAGFCGFVSVSLAQRI